MKLQVAKPLYFRNMVFVLRGKVDCTSDGKKINNVESMIASRLCEFVSVNIAK